MGDEQGNTSQQFKPLVEFFAPVSIFTGILVYSGWIRTRALFEYFGVTPSLFDYSVQDYLLRSVGVSFRPAILLLAATALGLACLAAIDKKAELFRRRKSLRRWLLVATIGMGVVLLLTTLIGMISDIAPPLLASVCLGLGAFIIYCSTKTVSMMSHDSKDRQGIDQRAAVLAAITTVVALFWTTAIYAQQVGLTTAVWVAHTPESRPGVIIYSRLPLHLEGHDGIIEKKLLGPPGAMNYRYTGYRLLLYSNNRWFLIPSRWSDSERNSTLVLLGNDSVMVELVPPSP